MSGLTSPLAIPYPTSTDTLKDALTVVIPALANQIDDLIVALSPVAATPWTALTTTANWTAGGIQYKRTAGVVWLSCTGSKSGTSGVTLATLPVGFRPSISLVIAGLQGAGVLAGITVDTAGVIKSDFGTGGYGLLAVPL